MTSLSRSQQCGSDDGDDEAVGEVESSVAALPVDRHRKFHKLVHAMWIIMGCPVSPSRHALWEGPTECHCHSPSRATSRQTSLSSSSHANETMASEAVSSPG